MKAINYKTNEMSGVVYSSNGSLETCNYLEHVLRIQNERQI